MPPHPEHVSVADLVSSYILAFEMPNYAFCFAVYGPRKFTEVTGLHNRGPTSDLIGALSIYIAMASSFVVGTGTHVQIQRVHFCQ